MLGVVRKNPNSLARVRVPVCIGYLVGSPDSPLLIEVVTAWCKVDFNRSFSGTCAGEHEPCSLRQVLATRAPQTLLHRHFDAHGEQELVDPLQLRDLVLATVPGTAVPVTAIRNSCARLGLWTRSRQVPCPVVELTEICAETTPAVLQ